MVETKLLIIDDDPGICETLSDIFEDRGYSVTIANTGSEAIDKAKQAAFDAALIDMKLPDMDGGELLKEFKKAYPEKVCIIITGHASLQNAVKALEEGASGYFIKPLVIEEVVHQVEEALDKQRLQRELKESEEKLRRFMESATDSFALYNSDLNLVEINEASLKMFPPGTKKEDVIGKNILDVLPNLKETDRYDQCLEVLKTGEPFFADDIVPHPKFGDIHLAIKAFKVSDGLGFIMTDITEREQAEEELAKHREHLEELVRARTTELRTIVNAMAGREVRMAELKETIQKLRAQLEEAGLTPVADDPLKEMRDL